MRQEADPGLFGPRSVTWQVHSDPVMWIAGVRALWLQALHPVAVRGVMINSSFRQDPWGRLMRTATFVGTLSYGTTEAAETAAARVRLIHRRLGVDDPELLLWVHCAETDSYLSVARRSGIPLSDARADRYVDEHRTSARLVGLDPAAVPRSTAELADYFDAVRPRLMRRPGRPHRRGVPPPPARRTGARTGARGDLAARRGARVRHSAPLRPRALRPPRPAARDRHPSSRRHGQPAPLHPLPPALAAAAPAHPPRHGPARSGDPARPLRVPRPVPTVRPGVHTGEAG